MSKKTKVEVIYDGQCPFCSKYVELIELKKYYDLKLIDARENRKIVNRIQKKIKKNINDGMFVLINNQIYFGASAMNVLEKKNFSQKKLSKIINLIFSKKILSSILYPFLAKLRKLYLLLNNIKKI